MFDFLTLILIHSLLPSLYFPSQIFMIYISLLVFFIFYSLYFCWYSLYFVLYSLYIFCCFYYSYFFLLVFFSDIYSFLQIIIVYLINTPFRFHYSLFTNFHHLFCTTYFFPSFRFQILIKLFIVWSLAFRHSTCVSFSSLKTSFPLH